MRFSFTFILKTNFSNFESFEQSFRNFQDKFRKELQGAPQNFDLGHAFKLKLFFNILDPSRIDFWSSKIFKIQDYFGLKILN